MREYIDEKITIDGRKIPYTVYTAGDYLMLHDGVTWKQMENGYMDENEEVCKRISQIMAIKQSCFLLRNTTYSCQSLSDDLYDLKIRLIKELKDKFDYEFDDEWVEEQCKKKEKLDIREFAPGNTVEFAGQKWNVLDEVEENKFLCVNNKVVCNKKFDNKGNNDWGKSSLRSYLNEEYLKKFTRVNLVLWKQDLMTDDGLDDYESSEDKIFLLTTDQYRKYRKNIRDAKDWWWLITAETTTMPFVKSVSMEGVIVGRHVSDYGFGGVRPACVVDVSI